MIILEHFFNLIIRIHHCRVIPIAEDFSNTDIARTEVFLEEEHHDLTWEEDLTDA